MVIFNTLYTSLVCKDCQKPNIAEILFEYGSVWQYKYQIGDVINWGENDFGTPSEGEVLIKGYLKNENCSSCGAVFIDDTCTITIQNNIIVDFINE